MDDGFSIATETEGTTLNLFQSIDYNLQELLPNPPYFFMQLGQKYIQMSRSG